MLPLRLRLGLMAIVLLAPVACFLPPTASDSPTTRSPGAGEAEQEAAKGINAFAAELYAQLRTEQGNLIVSPYSINTALAMTAAGAQGNTRAEMERVLHLPTGEKLSQGLPDAYRGCDASTGGREAQTGAFGRQFAVAPEGPPVQERVSGRLAKDDFHAGLFDVDFGDAGVASRRINKWVEDKTHNRIKDLVPPAVLNHDTQMVLANAIYFKARWSDSFEKKDTKPEDFTLTSGQKVRAPLMYQKANFLLREEEDLQVLRLPYDGKATAMYVILPRRADGLPALEQKLTEKSLWGWTLGQGKKPLEEVKVWLPRFKFTVPTELTDVLQKMGLTDAFVRERANFKGMTDHADGLFISRVLHKAFVETDEVGTEAAAATAVTMALATAAPPMAVPRVKEFRADHPFVFVIKHEDTGAVLFIGRVLDPTK